MQCTVPRLALLAPAVDRERQRALPSAIVLLLMILVALVAGCGSARPFTPDFYSPRKLTKLLEPLPPIAVYSLVDERGAREPTLILESASISGHSRWDHATEPVSGGVTRAFAQAFRARGFPIVDMTERYYSPSGQRAEARVAISGRVLEFGARIVRSGLFTYDQRVACTIVLEAYEVVSGRRLWTKSYSQVTEGGLLPADPITLLSRALAEVVEQGVTDPELLGVIQAARRE